MVLRLLMRLVANNERLIQRLSESYAVRRAAQWVVYFFYKGKGVVEDSNLNRSISPQQLKTFIAKLAQNITRELKQGKDQFKK